MARESTQLAVLGAGPGGYAAAFYAADLGMQAPLVDVAKRRAFKQGVVDKLTSGVGQVGRMRKVKFIQGRATLTGPKSMTIASQGRATEMAWRDALEVPEGPRSLLVIGGGYVGLELGTVYATLGSKVSVVEMTGGLLPVADRDLVQPLEKRLKTLFASIMVNTKVVKGAEEKNGIRVTFEGDVAEKEQVFERVLVSIGRRPNSKVPGLEKTRVKVDAKGFTETDPQRRTAEPSIFAIGDVGGGPTAA